MIGHLPAGKTPQMAKNKARQSKYERRVTLALKWYYLENLDLDEIRDKLLEAGFENPHSDDGRYSRETIQDYVNSKPGEEVREQIQQEHAHTRLQVADRQEQLYQRARQAETEATRDEPIVGMVPKTKKVDGRLKNPKRIPYDWEEVQPEDDDWPEWADPDLDTIIRFTEGSRMIEPGARYPLKNYLGEPEYTKEVKGLRRGEPDTTQRSFLRQEQQSHLTAKGEAMGIYEETINLQGDLGIEAEVEVPSELVEAVIGASHNRLSTGSDDGGEGDAE